jgi:hypothetical protein
MGINDVINKLSINNTRANLLHKTLFGFKILFVISLILFKKICNRPSQIHCLNSNGTGDLFLLRYKPDFVINELYCIPLHIIMDNVVGVYLGPGMGKA